MSKPSKLSVAQASLPESFRSIQVPKKGSFWRRFFAFVGPGYLVATGYMDPGNWATALAGGSAFGYSLLSIALLSNIMAIILQSLCVRLGLGAGLDLAQACRLYLPRWMKWPLWLLAEVAIIATDLAEVIGTAIGLQLLFGIPLVFGVAITAFDVFLILWLQSKGFRYLEAFIAALLMLIFVCFAFQIFWADPHWGQVLRGFIPTIELTRNPDMLYLAMGILGATVMPHNLYLHSAIVQSRDIGASVKEKKQAISYATWDSTLALMMALFVNAAILILAASTFHAGGHGKVEDIVKVHEFLTPMLGTSWAPTLFALALLACGLNSTVTATLAGQVVMQGFLDMQFPLWVRRLITRSCAIMPALLVIWIWGEQATTKLLIFSQVVLSLQLPFAVVPLVWMTSQKKIMHDLRPGKIIWGAALLIALLILSLNLKLILDFI